MTKFTHPKDAPKGHEWQTRGGLPARHIHTGLNGFPDWTVFLIKTRDCEEPQVVEDDGTCDERFYAIIDKPKTYDVWVCLWVSGVPEAFTNYESALGFCNLNSGSIIGPKKVTLTEGESE